MADKRMIISVTFREKDRALYDFVIKKGDVIGNSNYIKSLIDKAMKEEEECK